VAFVSPDRPKSVVTVPAAEALRPVGFDTDEAILPYPPNVFPGYRLLTEYFAYAPKFLYAELAGWNRLREVAGAVRQLDAVIFLDRSHTRLETLLDPGMFRLGCSPVVNLFEWTAEPIPLTHTRPEYK